MDVCERGCRLEGRLGKIKKGVEKINKYSDKRVREN